MELDLKDSILKGFPIPHITCLGQIEGKKEIRYIMDGGNRITALRHLLNNERGVLTPEERQQIESYQMTVVVVRNLTSKDQRLMFTRLNKNVRVSDGQLYAMSEEDSPLVQEAVALLNDDTYPLRDLITQHFFDTRNKDNNNNNNLANAVALVSGALHGPRFITKSYSVQEQYIESQEPINRTAVVTVLGSCLEIFTIADINIRPDGRKRKGQWNVGHLLGVIMYDIMIHPGETRMIQDKWVRFLIRYREGDELAPQAITLKGAQNLTATRYMRMSTKVDIYLRDNRIATENEIAALNHINDSDDEEDDNLSIISDEREDL